MKVSPPFTTVSGSDVCKRDVTATQQETLAHVAALNGAVEQLTMELSYTHQSYVRVVSVLDKLVVVCRDLQDRVDRLERGT